MALSYKTLSQSCLDYIDVPFIEQATPSQKMWVLNSINGALQELFSKGPPHLKRREMTYIIYGPTSVTMNVTTNSKQIYGMTGWADWMVGCTVRIDGDNFDNEIVDEKTLLQAYQGQPGAGGVMNAQVIGDAVQLPPEVATVLGCARLADIRELVPSPSREAFNRANYWHEGDYGEAILSVQVRRKWTGQPHTYWLDTVYLPEARLGTEEAGTTSGNIYERPARPWQPAVRIRLAPLPQQQYVLKFDAEMNPPRVLEDELGDGARHFQLPGNAAESILLPMVLQRWSACPWFKNDDARKEIARQFDDAQEQVYGRRPQRKRARRMNPVV